MQKAEEMKNKIIPNIQVQKLCKKKNSEHSKQKEE